MKIDKITLFGAGRMGAALAGGWLKAKLARVIDIVEPRPSPVVQAWAQADDVRLNPAADAADWLVVAVKPQMFGDLAPQISERVSSHTKVLSVMAGVSLATLEAKLGTKHVARAMPNTPGLIGKGITALSTIAGTSAEQIAAYKALLTPIGAVEGPVEEALLPAITAVSGAGPAYGFLLAEVMAAAGVAHGLDEALAMRLARKTVEGAGALMEASDEAAATLRQNVTSPGGVTQAALQVLMSDDAMPSLFEKAIGASIQRDHELSRESE